MPALLYHKEIDAPGDELGLDKDLYLARSHGQRHPLFGPDLKAFFYCFLNVFLGFALGFPLTDTARDRGALGNEHAILVLRYRYYELHPPHPLEMPLSRLLPESIAA